MSKMYVAGIRFVSFTAQSCIHKIITEVGGRTVAPYRPLAMSLRHARLIAKHQHHADKFCNKLILRLCLA